jgi:hypothetical protein
MTTKQATSGSGPHSGLVDRTYIVGSRPLNIDGTLRTPGQLVPEAGSWLPKVRDAHLGLGWLEEINLLSDHDRELADQQWQAEEAARAEAAAKRKAAEPPAPPPPAPLPEGAVKLACANCKKDRVFPEPPGRWAWWQCGSCGQRQTREQSEAGTLQLIAPHSFDHNHKLPTWRQE